MTEISSYARIVAAELTPEQRRLLRSTKPEGKQTTQDKDGQGQLRYTLRRKGLVRVTRPDSKGRFTAYRTPFGEQVLAALQPGAH